MLHYVRERDKTASQLNSSLIRYQHSLINTHKHLLFSAFGSTVAAGPSLTFRVVFLWRLGPSLMWRWMRRISWSTISVAIHTSWEQQTSKITGFLIWCPCWDRTTSLLTPQFVLFLSPSVCFSVCVCVCGVHSARSTQTPKENLP